jgi:hypothetical protein
VNHMDRAQNDSTDEQTKGQVVRTRVPASFRLTRTMVTGSMIVALAIGVHLAAGGALPHPMVMIGLAAVTMVPVAALSSRWLALPHLLLVLGLGQVLLHWSFTALGSQHSLEHIVGLSHHTGSHAATSAVDSAAVAAQFLSMSPSMFFGHVLATLTTAVLLARGEAFAKAMQVRPFPAGAHA